MSQRRRHIIVHSKDDFSIKSYFEMWRDFFASLKCQKFFQYGFGSVNINESLLDMIQVRFSNFFFFWCVQGWSTPNSSKVFYFLCMQKDNQTQVRFFNFLCVCTCADDSDPTQVRFSTCVCVTHTHI